MKKFVTTAILVSVLASPLLVSNASAGNYTLKDNGLSEINGNLNNVSGVTRYPIQQRVTRYPIQKRFVALKRKTDYRLKVVGEANDSSHHVLLPENSLD